MLHALFTGKYVIIKRNNFDMFIDLWEIFLSFFGMPTWTESSLGVQCVFVWMYLYLCLFALVAVQLVLFTFRIYL